MDNNKIKINTEDVYPDLKLANPDDVRKGTALSTDKLKNVFNTPTDFMTDNGAYYKKKMEIMPTLSPYTHWKVLNLALEAEADTAPPEGFPEEIWKQYANGIIELKQKKIAIGDAYENKVYEIGMEMDKEAEEYAYLDKLSANPNYFFETKGEERTKEINIKFDKQREEMLKGHQEKLDAKIAELSKITTYAQEGTKEYDEFLKKVDENNKVLANMETKNLKELEELEEKRKKEIEGLREKLGREQKDYIEKGYPKVEANLGALNAKINKAMEVRDGLLTEMDNAIEAEKDKQIQNFFDINNPRIMDQRLYFGPNDETTPVNLIKRMFHEDWNSRPVKQNGDPTTITDNDWVGSHFMAPFNNIPSENRVYLIKSTAHMKFMGTGLGEHVSCNPPPQFCPYSDIRDLDLVYPYKLEEFASGKDGKAALTQDAKLEIKDKATVKLGGYNPSHYLTYAPQYRIGMGRFYSTAIDDGKQLLYLQFGLPKFNGLLDFLRNGVSYVDACIANEGRIPETFIALDGWFFWVTAVAAPYLTTFTLLTKFLVSEVLLGDKPYNYYYLEPNMHVFWGTVNTIINHIATDEGLLIPLVEPKATNTVLGGGNSRYARVGNVVKFDMAMIKQFNSIFPGGLKLIDERTGYIDVRAITIRYQAFLDNVMTRNLKKLNKFKEVKENDPKSMAAEDKDKLPIVKGSSSSTKANSNNKQEFDQAAADQEYRNVRDRYRDFEENTTRNYLLGMVIDVANSWTTWMDETLFRDTVTEESTFALDTEYTYVDRKISPPYSERTQSKTASNKKPSNTSGVVGLEGINTGTGTNADINELEVARAKEGGFDGAEKDDNTQISSAVGGATQLYNMFLDAVDKSKKFVYSYWKRFAYTAVKTSRQAANYAVFSVQYTGQRSESFSNSVGEMETGGMIKSIGRSVRHAKFNLSGGVTGIAPVDAGLSIVKDAAMSLIHNASLGLDNIIRGVLMGAYMDIPKIWEDSDCSFQQVTYNIDLIAPYGNLYSRLQNIYIPLSILLAGALPLRVGKSSYTSPFLCSAYCKAIQNIRLGMITDLSVNSGITNLGFTLDKKTNGVSVSLTITDFEHKVSAPVNSSVYNIKGNSVFAPVIDQYSPMAVYSSLITAKNLEDLTWVSQRWRFRISNAVKSFHGIVKPENIGHYVGQMMEVSPAGWFVHNYIPEPMSR